MMITITIFHASGEQQSKTAARLFSIVSIKESEFTSLHATNVRCHPNCHYVANSIRVLSRKLLTNSV